MRTAAKVIDNVTKAKPAKQPSPTRYTEPAPKVYPQGQANSVAMSCKVSSETAAKAQAILKRNAQTQSGWLRGLIEQAVYLDQ